MTTRPAFTRAELAAASAVAVERGVAVVIERPDGHKVTVTPQTAPKADPFDFINMER